MINKSETIFNNLKKTYPSFDTFLNYDKDYEFLFAVILSAQTTDIKVNEATKKLFSDLNKLEDYSKDNYQIISNDIKSLGLYKNKTKNIINTANILLTRYNGKVPNNRDELMSLPGVGKKTSGVVLNQLYKTNLFPVDTHINRVSNRLGIVNEKNADIIEDKLEKYFNGYDLFYLHHAFILLGRNICTSFNPKCKICPLSNICKKNMEK